MGSSSKQRKKTDKATPPSAASASSSSSSPPPAAAAAASAATPGEDGMKSLADHLSRAQLAVERSKESILTLHQEWRTQLLRMSYLVMVVTLHIAQTPSSACIKDIKKWNLIQSENGQAGSFAISGQEAIVLVLHDSVVELMSIFCAAFLVWCLRLPMDGNDFSTIPYRLSCAVMPMIISLHFHRKSEASRINSDDGGGLSSCVSAASVVINNPNTLEIQDLRGGNDDDTTSIARHFPVILVFHLIVSISLWFMQYQNQQHQKNLDMVEKLKEDLLEVKKSKQDKKKR